MEKKTRSEAYYLDDDHNIVDPDKATKVVINEYDGNGMMIQETCGFVGSRRSSNEARAKPNFLTRLLKMIKAKYPPPRK